MSLRFRIVFSGACAALAVMLCVLCADHAREEAEAARSEALERYGGETVTLVVASEGMEAGDVVGAADVSERDWVSDLAPEDAMTSLDDVVGRQLTVPVAAGAPLTGLNFREGEAMADIPSGHVAVSVPVTDKLGLSGSVASGSRVVAYEVGESASRLLTADVTVLCVPSDSGSVVRETQVSVAVPPDDVSAILTASASGDLRLVQPADDVESVGDGDVAAPGDVAEADGSQAEEDGAQAEEGQATGGEVA